MENEASDISPKVSLIKFVIKTGYKDEPKVDENGELLFRRTTELHRANKWTFDVRNLFKVYDRFDVNYTDESGLTHLHMACKHGFDYFVEKFLRLGQDPNCVCQETGDSPLHSTVIWDTRTNNRMIKLLLEHGANPNLANNDGSTPMHIICKNMLDMSTAAEPFFETHDRKHHTVLFNAQDKWDQTPLHYALAEGSQRIAQMLLERGADRNVVNAEGSTPLHVLPYNNLICNNNKIV
uniref:Uncharacterized protein n=1 Tax=Trichogramma kaykai TaxID=54128 RepID=A0ABD2XJW8_9HYME